MVFYFTLHSDPNILCYMGRDKYENEDLIRWGWPEDIWFHVDSHSSAHVYVRMPPGKGMNDLSPEMIEECCQLTKQNSIEGCKLNMIKIVFTPWSNLKKTNGMEVGQVSFHNESLRRYHTIPKKDTTILNRLEKTRVEKEDVNFQELREQRDAEERRTKKHEMLAAEERKKKEAEEEKKAQELKSYSSLNDQAKMTSNQDCVPDEDDFM